MSSSSRTQITQDNTMTFKQFYEKNRNAVILQTAGPSGTVADLSTVETRKHGNSRVMSTRSRNMANSVLEYTIEEDE